MSLHTKKQVFKIIPTGMVLRKTHVQKNYWGSELRLSLAPWLLKLLTISSSGSTMLIKEDAKRKQ